MIGVDCFILNINKIQDIYLACEQLICVKVLKV